MRSTVSSNSTRKTNRKQAGYRLKHTHTHTRKAAHLKGVRAQDERLQRARKQRTSRATLRRECECAARVLCSRFVVFAVIAIQLCMRMDRADRDGRPRWPLGNQIKSRIASFDSDSTSATFGASRRRCDGMPIAYFHNLLIAYAGGGTWKTGRIIDDWHENKRSLPAAPRQSSSNTEPQKGTSFCGLSITRARDPVPRHQRRGFVVSHTNNKKKTPNTKAL